MTNHSTIQPLGLLGVSMKEILQQMEEHIAAIRNLQRNFDFHSKKLEKLMKSLDHWHMENNREDQTEIDPLAR
jgi:hypothetical protein